MGFRIRFRNQLETEDVVRVHFYASGLEGTIKAVSSGTEFITAEHASVGSVHTVRACLSNPAGDGGFVENMAGNKIILPSLYESGPTCCEEVRGEGDITAWVPGRRRFMNEMKGDIWMSFDFFSCESLSQTHPSNTCTIS